MDMNEEYYRYDSGQNQENNSVGNDPAENTNMENGSTEYGAVGNGATENGTMGSVAAESADDKGNGYDGGADANHAYSSGITDGSASVDSGYGSSLGNSTGTDSGYRSTSGTGSSYNNRSTWDQPGEGSSTYRYKFDRVDNGAVPKEPVRRARQLPKPKREKSGNGNGILKRGLALLLAGVLFGGAAGGVFVGVTHIAQSKGIIAGVEKETQQGISDGAQDESQVAALPNGQGSTGESSAVRIADNGTAARLDVSDVVDKVMPSVVGITNTQIYENINNYYDYFRYFFGGGYGGGYPGDGEQKEYTAGSGSGIIIGENDTEYLIVTNNHVIEGASSLTITFADDSTATANVKGSDSEADLAVVAVDKSALSNETKSAISVATLGDSSELKPGQGVIAIGNALGFGQSVTVGYISALNREVTTDDNVTRTLLQTDAAINPGNSGGALVNLDGEIIGINAAKYSDTQVEGIGYAIPVTAVEDIIGDLMGRRTKVEVPEEQRGYLGINGASVDDATAQNLGMPKGVYVYSVIENGAAASAGILPKDIITKLDGERVVTMQQLQESLASYSMGDTVPVTVERLENGEYAEHEVSVTLQKKPEE